MLPTSERIRFVVHISQTYKSSPLFCVLYQKLFAIVLVSDLSAFLNWSPIGCVSCSQFLVKDVFKSGFAGNTATSCVSRLRILVFQCNVG